MRRIAYFMSLLVILTMSWEHFLVIPGLGSASRVVGILAAMFWLLAVLVTGKIRSLKPFHIFVFLFILWNAASILWTIDPDRTLVQIITYVQMGILSLIIWDLYTSPAAIKTALQVYVFGTTVPIVGTIADFITRSQTEYVLYGRYSASGSNANTTGILLAMGLPLAWYLAASAGEGKSGQLLRLVNYAYIAAMTFAIVLTATRFAIIMALPAFLFGLSSLGSLRPLVRIVIFAFLTTILLTVGSLVPRASYERLQTIDDELQGGNLSERTELWQRGIDLWLQHPITGIGSAGFDTAVEPIYGRKRAVHNSFIAIAAELGIVGLVLFGMIFTITAFEAMRHWSKWDIQFWLTVLFVWGLGNFALTWVYSKPTWLVLNLIVASASQLHLHDRQKLHVTRGGKYQTPLSLGPLRDASRSSLSVE